MRFALFFIPALLAAVEVEITGVTATQAVAQISGHGSSACTLNLYEGNSSSGTLHPDVTASVDTSRSDTIVWADGRRFVTIGHQRLNLALAADTEYYLAVSVCGTASARFRTPPPAVGPTMPIPLEADATNYHNAPFPKIDYTDAGLGKWYTDPTTGVKLKILVPPSALTWAMHDTDTTTLQSGGDGWTNVNNVQNGDSSNATTTNTNWVYFYPRMNVPWNGEGKTLENIGVLPYIQCSGATLGSADCDAEMEMFVHPNQVSAPAGFGTITLPGQSTMTLVPGGSHLPGSGFDAADGAFPTTFPQPGFAGWGTGGTGVVIPQGLVSYEHPFLEGSVSSGVVTFHGSHHAVEGARHDGVTARYHLSSHLQAGDYIMILEPDVYSNHGTFEIASNDAPWQVTLADTSVNLTHKLLFPMSWGVRIRKKTSAAGTLTVGVRFKGSGGFNSTTAHGSTQWSNQEVTDADGKVGRAAIVNAKGDYRSLMFISNDGEVTRLIAPLGYNAGPITGGQFSPTDPTVFYGTSDSTLLKCTYGGNWKTNSWGNNPAKSYTIQGDYTWNYTAANSEVGISCVNALPLGIASQIEAAYPSQVSSPYPAWTSFNLVGVGGDVAVIYRNLGGQDRGPCQVAVFNLASTPTPGVLMDFVNTLDLGEDAPITVGGVCHSIALAGQGVYYSSNISRETNGLDLHSGKWRIKVKSVKRSGSWSNNIALPWPTDSSYDTGCPSVGGGAGQMPQRYYDFGAKPGQCVTFRIEGTASTAVCNTTASSGDRTLFGVCPWDASNTSASGGPALHRGQSFVNEALGGGAPGDAEHFLVLTISDLGDGTSEVVAMRNASRDYCCANPVAEGTGGSTFGCWNSAGQNTHSDSNGSGTEGGWDALLTGGSIASCNGTVAIWTYANSASPAREYIEQSRTMQGHTGAGSAPGGKTRFLGGGTAATLNAYSDIGNQPLPATYPVKMFFEGVDPGIGGCCVQQYLGHSGWASPGNLLEVSTDQNYLNPASGFVGNYAGNWISGGGRTFTNVTGNIWKIGVVGSVDIKRRPLIGWSGPKNLGDISSPTTGNTIDAAADYSMCYAYKNNECRTGSTAGEAFVKVPRVITYTTGNAALLNITRTEDRDYFASDKPGIAGMEWMGQPYIWSATPSVGYIRRYWSGRPDQTGAGNQLITSGLRPPGTHWPLITTSMHPNGQLLVTPANTMDGMRQGNWLIKLPSFPDNNQWRNKLGGITLNIGAQSGVTHARVRFGYNTSFYCTSRAEACVTDASVAPFAFMQSDTLTGTSCSSGCTITLPVDPRRLTYYRLETSGDGSTWNTSGETRVAAP